ncbi:glycoside hydrolase 100 family protein [Roseisolibacter sp. H3M3-2]|uniref:glycoside hydrolase 100 family protein n=1 Tax=Roseisolibacter sp. H3M3-2 TaxID=3031323 RepID=UPI0023DBDB92|nr:glycoside hydrolase 100 family protein [Roseisolibacter sp. H3M3-2]MDF1504516.1 glycoside hydrolase 100 family protein [Roseisolibacter sp. H3M3-2]
MAADLHARAVALLRALCGPHGIHASLAETANYRAVFTRDAVVAGVAGLLLGDDVVAAGLARTLERLRALQGPEGQLASNFEPRDGGAPHVSFGSLVPRVDAVTWYLVGVALAARAGVVDAADHADSARAAVRLLDALEYNGRDLVYVPAGGNWADEYVYEGYILYDQVLRAWALRLLAGTYGEARWEEKAARIGAAIDARYWPARAEGAPRDGPSRDGHPVAAFSPVRTCEAFDLAACALLGASGVAPASAAAALDWADAHFGRRGALAPAFHPVIDEAHPDWPALARYHLFGFRNRPHEYHNGGIWPVWLGWQALALAATGRDDALARLRASAAAALDVPAFDFQEYLHGVTGEPLGTPRMAYSATGVVLLAAAGTPAQREVLGG